jgi:cytoskeletal protein CcmA (bactofilin family)
MALFRPSEPQPTVSMAKSRVSASSNPADQHNIIGAATVLEGTLRADGSVNIAGTVNGNVEVEGRTIVAAGGTVDGEVISTSAEIAGTVRGQLTVGERLVLKATAVVEGDIRTAKLVVEDGATFDGKCVMTGTRSASGSSERAPGVPAAPVLEDAA